jgi:hypothetical protein
MFLARAADAVLRRIVPTVEASAACTPGCRLRYTSCGSCRPRQTERYYTRSASCAWGAACKTVTCGNLPCD